MNSDLHEIILTQIAGLRSSAEAFSAQRDASQVAADSAETQRMSAETRADALQESYEALLTELGETPLPEAPEGPEGPTE